MAKRLSFTTKNVINSFSSVTGFSPTNLFIDERMSRSTKRCSIRVSSYFEDGVTIYRDQKALDESAAEDLPYDELEGFYDVGDLSMEDVLRHASKGCTLSDLRHWIISEGRDHSLSDAEIKVQLKRPLETLIEHYREYDMEGAYSRLIRQCRVDESQMAKHLLKAAGGAQKVWKDEFYEELPGGFIVHIIANEEISFFRKFKEAHRKKVRRLASRAPRAPRPPG